jgi:glycosyltransferase EpsD
MALKTKRKVLFVANIHKHFSAFHIPYINWLKSQGFEVHVAANDGSTRISEADKQFDISINRNPFSIRNIIALKDLKNILKKEKYCLVHCHTAMGSVIARLAAKKFRINNNLIVIYTVHGFHFYKDSPRIYWELYYKMEKYLSRFTDAIITINEEDYQIVKSNQFKNQYSFKTSGVGINTNKFNGLDFSDLASVRLRNKYSDEVFLIIYIAEFIPRKNHRFIIESIPILKENLENFKFIFAGRGVLKNEIENLAMENGVTSYIDFLGFRKDIGELIWMSNIGVSVSNQEGLPMNVAEEMYASKPVIATQIRGHVDLIDHGKDGFLFRKHDKKSFVAHIKYLYENPDKRLQIGEEAKIKSKKFELENCLSEMQSIYKQFLDV